MKIWKGGDSMLFDPLFDFGMTGEESELEDMFKELVNYETKVWKKAYDKDFTSFLTEVRKAIREERDYSALKTQFEADGLEKIRKLFNRINHITSLSEKELKKVYYETFGRRRPQ